METSHDDTAFGSVRSLPPTSEITDQSLSDKLAEASIRHAPSGCRGQHGNTLCGLHVCDDDGAENNAHQIGDLSYSDCARCL
ncbi:hypothetical protein BaRGS_00039666 [Batillaria attramentaria]|uniref:Uncharacterized protein n=1 Tax=Batillaria attramentaria TaxID=370345 RepID=A0ABD0J265_9CAEN